jgi:hypothetical protein
MAEQIDNEYDTRYDNGYDTDHEHNHEEQEQNEHLDEQNFGITEEQTVLVKNYIIESIKHSPNTQYVRELFNNIIQQKLIKARDYHQDLIEKPYVDGNISDAYLHNQNNDDIDYIMYNLLSPTITKEEYDILDSLNPCIKSLDYGSKFIDFIKFYKDFIIIIFPFDEKIDTPTPTQKILKIDRNNTIEELSPTLTVNENGNIIILDWKNMFTFGRDITQFSKLCFRKNGIITDVYWTNKEGIMYREYLLPSHIALRPNRFQNCWYLEYNSTLILEDNPDEIVNFTINCCDS